MVLALRRFAEQQGRPAVFPDFSGPTGLAVYGKYTEPGTLSHQVIEMVAAEINSCAHIRSSSNPTSTWEPKPLESVRANYIVKIGKEEGQEDLEAFEAFASCVQPAPEPDSSALSALPTQVGAGAAMDTSEDQPAAASSSGSDQPSASAVALREPSTPADEESLLQAARWGQVDVVRRLLAAGVDPDTPQAYLVSAPDGWLSPTALMVACAQGWASSLADHLVPHGPLPWRTDSADPSWNSRWRIGDMDFSLEGGWHSRMLKWLVETHGLKWDTPGGRGGWWERETEAVRPGTHRRTPEGADIPLEQQDHTQYTALLKLRASHISAREEEAKMAVSSRRIGGITLLGAWSAASSRNSYVRAFGRGGERRTAAIGMAVSSGTSTTLRCSSISPTAIAHRAPPASLRHTLRSSHLCSIVEHARTSMVAQLSTLHSTPALPRRQHCCRDTHWSSRCCLRVLRQKQRGSGRRRRRKQQLLMRLGQRLRPGQQPTQPSGRSFEPQCERPCRRSQWQRRSPTVKTRQRWQHGAWWTPEALGQFETRRATRFALDAMSGETLAGCSWGSAAYALITRRVRASVVASSPLAASRALMTHGTMRSRSFAI